MFAQGVRCSCGQECLLPDFRFYYDGTRVAILPLLEASFMQELNEPDQRQRFVGAVRQRLGVEHVDLVLRGEQPPEYVVEYVR
jgi:hypothetical protein